MFNMDAKAILLVAVTLVLLHVTSARNIVFIVADDLGWNDVGIHNPDMITPNIDRLANRGVILDNAYVQPVCTPTRHSIMTGVYPFKVGLQRNVIIPFFPQCSPLNLTFLPEQLKRNGYATHAIGKWHLGMCNVNCTPTYRGFDTFLGFYNGKEDYYTKEIFNGKDFVENNMPVNNTEYSTYVYAKRATEIIRNHDKTKPLFMYLPFQSVHNPTQVPEKYERMYPNVKTENRRKYCGMVTAMDEAIGEVVEQLVKSGLMNDTLIVFTADNGGMPKDGGNNYPLRGAKTTIFEGGTRAFSFIFGNGVEKTGYKYEGMMHAVDWNPTILSAAGVKNEIDYAIDGIDQWESISKGQPSKRSEFIYNLDNEFLAPQGHAAIRVGNYKLIQGYPGPLQDWYSPDEDLDDGLKQLCLENDNEYYNRLAKQSMGKDGIITTGDRLYNLHEDPNEYNDIADTHKDIVEALKKKLDDYRAELVPPKEYLPDPKSNPDHYGGFWLPGWC